jgi:hypothetical protein
MYHKLAGMTGTAETEAAELWSIYKLDVVIFQPIYLSPVKTSRTWYIKHGKKNLSQLLMK